MGRDTARKIAGLIVAVSVAFVAVLLIMIQFQTDLLFPVRAVPPAGPLPPGAERLQVATAGGDVLHGVLLRPTAGDKTTALIIGFGGNAWNGQEVATYLHGIFPEAHVVAFHYRGYPPSTGSPSAEALMADAPLLFDEAVRRVAPDHVVAVGFSIGSGVAASLSRQRELDGVILVTPFDSLKAVAQQLYPWLPIGPLFRHEMPAADDIDRGTPAAIIAAERDEIIPAVRTDALRRRVPNLLYDRTIVGAGHNDIYRRADFQAALREAFDAVASQ